MGISWISFLCLFLALGTPQTTGYEHGVLNQRYTACCTSPQAPAPRVVSRVRNIGSIVNLKSANFYIHVILHITAFLFSMAPKLDRLSCSHPPPRVSIQIA